MTASQLTKQKPKQNKTTLENTKKKKKTKKKPSELIIKTNTHTPKQVYAANFHIKSTSPLMFSCITLASDLLNLNCSVYVSYDII